MSIYGTSINCEGVPKTQNGQTKIKFRAQDLHTMTATVRTQTRDVTSFWYWQYTHRRRTVNGLSEIDKIRILTIKAWRKHGTVYPMNMKAASSPKRRYIYLPCSLGLDSTELPNFNISQFIKFYFISNFTKIRRQGAELLSRRSDGWTDSRDEANGRLFTILRTSIVKDKYMSSSSVFEERLAHCLLPRT